MYKNSPGYSKHKRTNTNSIEPYCEPSHKIKNDGSIRINRGTSLSSNDNLLGVGIYYKIVNHIESTDFLKNLDKNSPAGLVYFKILLMFRKPEKYLDCCLENEITRKDKHQIFRDASFSNNIINEYIKTQLDMDKLILPYLKKWGKGSFKPESYELLKRVDTVVSDLFKIIKLLPQAIIYLLNRTYNIALSKKKDEKKMGMSLLFLGILMPLFLTNNNITSKNKINNLIQICRIIQSLVNKIINGETSEEMKKHIQEKLILFAGYLPLIAIL